MAFFGVTKEKIKKIIEHKNADNLEIASLEGMSFQFIIRKGIWNVGDECLYFPIDSLLPNEVMLELGLASQDENGVITGFLCGPNKNRIKTIRLRGEISQGLIGPLSLIDNLKSEINSENITDFLGIKKWEPQPVFCNSANLVGLPLGLSMYDIEGGDRFPKIISYLNDKKVYITEKLEGMNFSVFVRKGGERFVNQRRFSIVPIEGKEHSFWKVSEKQNFFEIAETIREELNCETVGFYGEFVGPNVQKNIYHLNETQVFIFDIMIDGSFVSYDKFIELIKRFNLQVVPLLESNKTLAEILNGKTIQEYSDGKSTLFKTDREGVVIKPMIEEYSNDLGGRLILKQRSPKYLAKNDN